MFYPDELCPPNSYFTLFGKNRFPGFIREMKTCLEVYEPSRRPAAAVSKGSPDGRTHLPASLRGLGSQRALSFWKKEAKFKAWCPTSHPGGWLPSKNRKTCVGHTVWKLEPWALLAGT